MEQHLYIPPTNETPEVDFRFADNCLRIKGESYPENAISFYGPIRASLESYLTQLPPGQPVEMHFHLTYFNSSSTKLIRALFSLLHNNASNGKPIVTHWYHDAEDDMMAEFGMDLREEFKALDFRAVALENT